MTSRRRFLAEGLCLAGACVAPEGIGKALAPDALSGEAGATITPTTIAEAQKIHALQFTASQRQELAAAVPEQVKGVVGLRRVPQAACSAAGSAF